MTDDTSVEIVVQLKSNDVQSSDIQDVRGSDSSEVSICSEMKSHTKRKLDVST